MLRSVIITKYQRDQFHREKFNNYIHNYIQNQYEQRQRICCASAEIKKIPVLKIPGTGKPIRLLGIPSVLSCYVKDYIYVCSC